MKKAFLFTPALLALSISTISNAHAYDHLYVFGDSLSDIGNKGCYTTKDESGACLSYTKSLAKIWMGEDLIASDKGGSNYAVGGAKSIWQPNFEDPNNTTETQLDKYFASTNGKADPNGVYMHWVGGNDLAAALTTKQIDPNAADSIVNKSANATAAQINELVKRGAGLIIAPNVPDVGKTPELLEQLLKQSILNQVLIANGFDPADVNKEIRQKIEKSDGYKAKVHETLTSVRNGINGYDTPSSVFRRVVLEGALKKIAEKSANVDEAKTDDEKKIANAKAEEIYKRLITAYDKVSKDGTELTNKYNELVEDKIRKSGNILRADINSLFNEVIENPIPYGISNTLGYECPQGISASECTKDMTVTVGDRKFVFADPLHPTKEVERIIDQYIESIYIAPSQVMTLNQVNRAPVKGTRASLDGHLQQLRSGGNEQGKTGVFGGYSGGRNTTFTLGGDYQLTESLLLGALYSNDNTERSPTSNFSYQSDAHVATAYGLWNVFNKAWLSGDLHYADINYDSLTRSIKLGQATRREVGSTTGTQWGARLTANWDIPVTNIVTTSPIVQFSWDKGDVKGYRESGHQSSAMHFSDQSYTSKIATLGWRVDTQLGRFNPYASVQFNHQFGDTQSKMRSAINSTKTSFVVDSGKQSKDWRQYTVGANANLFGNVRGFASVTRNEGSAQDANYDFSLGINASF